MLELEEKFDEYLKHATHCVQCFMFIILVFPQPIVCSLLATHISNLFSALNNPISETHH